MFRSLSGIVIGSVLYYTVKGYSSEQVGRYSSAMAVKHISGLMPKKKDFRVEKF